MKNQVYTEHALRQFCICFVALFAIISCTTTDEAKIEKLMKQYAKTNIADYKSFEIIQMDSVKATYSNLLDETTIIYLNDRYIFFSDSITALEREQHSIEMYLEESKFNLRRLHRQYQTTSWDLLTSFTSSNVGYFMNTLSEGATLEDAMGILQQNINKAEAYKNSILNTIYSFTDSLYSIQQKASDYCNSYNPKYLGKETIVKCRYKGEDGNMKVDSYRIILDDQLSSIMSLKNVKEIVTPSNRVKNFVDYVMENEYDYDYDNKNDDDEWENVNNGLNIVSNNYVVIDGTDLRLRLGPSTSADTFKWGDGSNRHPNKGEKFKYLGESGDFYKIDYKGHELWVSKQFTHLE